MKCPQCQTENKESRRFCSKCGAPLSIKCPKCGFVNEPEDQFCGGCGQSLTPAPDVTVTKPPVLPPKLEETYAQLQRFIPPSLAERMRLAQQKLEGENRLVTALFADISGFTPMSQNLTAEAVVEKVNQCFKAIIDTVYRYEGSINRFIGDCALAFFGAPLSHENDPERAILAALDMCQEISKLGLNISVGINSGMMYFGPIGSQEHLEISAYGMDIILAKRLQEAAKPGQILVGSGEYRLSRKAFDFNRLEPLSLKGLESPIIAYEVLRIRERPEKLRGLEGLQAQMIGRNREFADLKEATDQWLQGQGQIVSIIGEAGIGKSRLVSELKNYLQGQKEEIASPSARNDSEESVIARVSRSPEPFAPLRINSAQDKLREGAATKQSHVETTRRVVSTTLEGRCVSIGQPISYWPFLDILRAYFNLSASDTEREVATKLAESIQRLFPQSSDDILPFLGQLMSIKFGNDLDKRLQFATPEQIKHQTLMRLKDLFVTLAKERPLLLIFEDLHWADDLSLDLISLLMDELIATPLMLLCVYRPEREHRVWQLSSLAQRKCLDRYTEITLKKLSSRESRQLVETLLTIDNLPESVKGMILQKSEGNPFFIEEVIRSLIDRDIIYREGERWKARAEVVEIEVPDTIQSVILTRVDRLKAEAKYVLQCASVIGRLFKYRLLEHLARHERDLDKYIDEFEAKELVYEERTVPELEYAFRHALTQEATYQGILERKRREFHQQVAEGIEALYQERIGEFYEQLAYHYDKSGVVEKAIEYLLKAGEKARKAYLNNEAIDYFQRALELVGATHASPLQKTWRLEALKGLGEVYQGTGKVSEAEEFFRQAIALGQEMKLAPRELVRLYERLGMVLWFQNQYDEAIRLGEEGLALLGDDIESVEAALMNSIVALNYGSKGNQEKWREFNYRNVQFIQRLSYSEELWSAYIHITTMCTAGDKNVEEAKKWLDALERIARQHHDLIALGWVHHWTGVAILSNIGDLRGAISQHQRSIELFTKTGDVKYEVQSLMRIVWASLSLGDLQKASEYVCRAYEIAEDMGLKGFIGWLYMGLGTISLCQGSWEKATGAFQKATHLYREVGARWGWGREEATLSLGRAYLAQGKRQEALGQFQEAIAIASVKTDFFISGTRSIRTEILAAALSGLEEACDNPEDFQAFCHRFREEHPDAGGSAFVQWHLEPTNVGALLAAPLNLFHDDFVETLHATSLHAPWIWHDQFGDCSFTVQNGLEIHAANGRDLWHINLSAPRILQPVGAYCNTPLHFAVQTVCVPASADKPSIGGILLWKDKENYLRLDKGTRGEREISFSGCIGNKDVIIGRGRLPVNKSRGAGEQRSREEEKDIERVFLRLERIGSRMNTLCSADGVEWFTVGHVEFPVDDPVEVGLHAIGNIDRTIYHGAFSEGTAIRFLSFQLSAPG